jgi:hypothetical protein
VFQIISVLRFYYNRVFKSQFIPERYTKNDFSIHHFGSLLNMGASPYDPLVSGHRTPYVEAHPTSTSLSYPALCRINLNLEGLTSGAPCIQWLLCQRCSILQRLSYRKMCQTRSSTRVLCVLKTILLIFRYFLV